MRQAPQLAVLTTALALLLCGCSGSDPTTAIPATSGSAASADSATVAVPNGPADLVPAAVKSRGTLRVATSAALAPQTYLDDDGVTIVGYFPDLITEAATRLGLGVEFVKTPFSGIIAGIQADRYDVGITFQDTAERREVVNIVDMIKATQRFVTQSQGGIDATPPCGKVVGVGSGSAEENMVKEISQKDCVDQGKDPIDIQVFPNNPAANVALSSGQIQATLQNADTAVFLIANSDGTLRQVGDLLDRGAYSGAIVAPAQAALGEALQSALQDMVADGSYLRILTEFGVQDNALDTVTINLEQG